MTTTLVEPIEPMPNGNNDHSAGNKITQKYKYDFVINNYTEEELSHLKTTIPSIAKKAIIGKEVGEQGTPHLQCYISLLRKLRITELTKLAGLERASFRECRNELALIEYCRKGKDIFLSVGFPKQIKTIETLYPWQQQILELYNTEPDDRSIHWFWEPNGNIGKSAFVKYMVIKHKALFCDGGKKNDLINLVFNNNMDECKCIIWDIPRASKGSISYSTLEAVKNGLVCNTKYETGVKAFNSPHVFVFANFEPENMDNLSPDRWKITKINSS
nr:MAG: replication associated protein [Cressdnaviricota sp.]